MKVNPSQLVERQGVQEVGALVVRTLGWLFREQPVSDIGVDAHTEVVAQGEAEGRLIGLQVKSGSSYFARPTTGDGGGGGGWTFAFDDDHYRYWLNHDLPIAIVLHDPERGAYFQAITPETVVSTGEGWRVDVPGEQPLDATAIPALTALAARPRFRGDAALQRFLTDLELLPPEAAYRLRQAHDEARAVDPGARRPVERLADALASQRDDPLACCTALLDQPPSWIPAMAWRLWAAVAAYANEHELPVETRRAFERTADEGGQPLGRWRALAGLALIGVNPDTAAAALVAARALPGGQVLADVGIALIEHGDSPGPAPIPGSVIDSSTETADLRADATVQRLLGDQRLAARDLSGAVAHYDQASLRAPSSSSLQITLARTLLMRVSTAAAPVRGLDLQRAQRLAEAARADRRRWNGPSEDAAEVLLSVRLLGQDVPGALAVALQAPEGEATEREATAEGLAARAARAAYRMDLGDVAEQLAARVPEASWRASLLAAVRADTRHEDSEVRRSLWRVAVDAAADNEHRVLSCHSLADLGEWPIAALDRLHASGAIDEELHDLLHARAEAATGQHEQAIARLRRWEPTSPSAAEQLAVMLEEAGRVQHAVEVCDRAAMRFDEISARLLALDLLRRAGDDRAFLDRALRLLARTDLATDVRRHLRRRLVAMSFAGQDWDAVEEQASAGLAELVGDPDVLGDAAAEDVAELAWSVVGARFNQRRWEDAWSTLRELDPPVRTRQDAMVWFTLAARRTWTAGRARAGLGLVDRFEEDADLGAAVLGSLLIAFREADAEPGITASGERQPSGSGGANLAGDDRQELMTELRATLDRYTRRHPDGPLRSVAFDAAMALDVMREQLAPRAEILEQVTRGIRDSQVPVGVAASAAGRPYLLALLQRVGGITPAGTSDPDVYDQELAAAEAGLGGGVVIEPSAVVVATLLPGRWRELRSRFTESLLPRVCVDDVLATEQRIVTLAASSMSVGLDVASQQLVRSALTAEEKLLLRDRSRAVAVAASELTVVEIASLARVTVEMNGHAIAAVPPFTLRREGPWLAPLELALVRGLPLWSDDVVLRMLARDMGAEVFGTLALSHAMFEREQMPDTTQGDLAVLLGEYVVDLPLTRELLLTQAERDEWRPAAAAVALSRPAAWRHDIDGGFDTWTAVAIEVFRRRPDMLPGWLHAATLGYSAAGAAENVASLTAQLLAITLVTVTGLRREAVDQLLPTARAAARERSGHDVDPLPPLRVALVAVLQEPEGGGHHEGEARRRTDELLLG